MAGITSCNVTEFRHQPSGAEGRCLLLLDRDLRITFATPQAIVRCGLENYVTGNTATPLSLLQPLQLALDTESGIFIWSMTVAGQIHTLEVHLCHTRDKLGRIDGYQLVLLESNPHAAAEMRLRQQNSVLDALVNIDWMLNTADQWQAALPETMSRIGKACGFRRIQLFQLHQKKSHPGSLRQFFSWDANEHIVHPHQNAFPNQPRWLELLREAKPVYGKRLDFPLEEQALLQNLQIDGLALVPIFLDKKCWGAISFEQSAFHEDWSHQQIDPLLSVARSLGIAIQRQIAHERLEQARLAFDSTAEGIMICDANRRITAVNKGFTAITGYSEEEAVGRTPGILHASENSKEFYTRMWEAISRDGGWRGEIWDRRKNGETYPQWLTITAARNREGATTHYVAVFADISEAKTSQQKLHQLVNHDPLTGLPNRRLLHELLERSLLQCNRTNQRLGLLFVDLDRFKSVNDTLGHHAGDQLLSSVTQRLSASVRESDTIARLSGDEFIIMMEGLKHAEDAAVVARKIISTLKQSFIIEGSEVFIGASVGISTYPQDGNTANDLIRAADIAMYQAKHEGRNDFRFYTPRLGENAHERMTLETMLRHALERNQLVVHYQPQISLTTGRIVGAEALLRWQHPEQGMIAPGKFIPLAEETGLIIPIGEWILREAAQAMLRIEDAGSSLDWLAVNVSAHQMHRSNFADTVYGILVETGCPAEKLELEITETAIMTNVDYAIDVCRKLKDMGLRLALDDFGTGYSSLSYLKRFPLDKLKLDRSFVGELPEDTDDAAISGAIIGLGHNLGLTVIAEGVETHAQEHFLQDKGCHEAQGFLYSKPVPFSTLLECIQANHA